MHVIFDPADDDRLAIAPAPYSADVTMKFFARRLVAKERKAIFCRKNSVHQNFCE